MIYKRQTLQHSLPTNYSKLDAESQYMLSDFKGLQIFDNPLLADLKSTYSCKNVYVDETKTLTVRPRLNKTDTAIDRVFIHTATNKRFEWYKTASTGELRYRVKSGESYVTSKSITINPDSNVVFFDDYEQAYFLVQQSDKLRFIDENFEEVTGDILLANSTEDIDRFNILNNRIILNKNILKPYPEYTNLDEVKKESTNKTIECDECYTNGDLTLFLSYPEDEEGLYIQLQLYNSAQNTIVTAKHKCDDLIADTYHTVQFGRDVSNNLFASVSFAYDSTVYTASLTEITETEYTKPEEIAATNVTLIPESDESRLWIGHDHHNILAIYRQSGAAEKLVQYDNVIAKEIIASNQLVYTGDGIVYDLFGNKYTFGIYERVIPTNIGLIGVNISSITLLQNSGRRITLDLSSLNQSILWTDLKFYDSTRILFDIPGTHSAILWDYISNIYYLITSAGTAHIVSPQYLLDNTLYKISFEFRQEYARSTEIVPQLSTIEDKPITGFYLDGFYWAITQHHVFGSGANGEGQLTIEYWDPYKYFKISETITGAMRVSDTSFWVFHNNGAYLIYKSSTPDDSGRYLWLSTPTARFKGCDFENAVNILPISNYTCVVTDDDISIVQLRENVQSDDRVLVPMTTKLSALVSEILNETESVLIGTYKYLSLFFCNPTTQAGSVPILVYDNAQDNWWYWEIPVNEVRQILPGTPLQFITDQGTFSFAEDYIDNLYCDDGDKQITWYWQSAIQLFGNLTNRKQLLQTLFTFCDIGQNDSNLDYRFMVYSKEQPDEMSKTFAETLTYRVKNNTVRTLISSFTYLQLELSNSTTESDMTMDADSVKTKPKLVSIIFKFRNLQGGLT